MKTDRQVPSENPYFVLAYINKTKIKQQNTNQANKNENKCFEGDLRHSGITRKAWKYYFMTIHVTN